MASERSPRGKGKGAGSAVAKHLPTPLYHQIYLLLRDEIVSGDRPFGSLLPTEQELSRIHGVSRITTRRALEELAQNHFVERKRRVGTRVIFEAPSPPIEASIEQAVESLLALGRSTKVKLLSLSEEVAQAQVAERLRLAPQEKVVSALRVRWLDDQPLGCVASYVPSRLGLKFTRVQLEATPILTLLEEAGLKIGSAAQTIAATSADPSLAEMLHIESRAPVLRICRTAYGADGEPILYTIAQYRADRYQIRLDLHSFDGP